MEIKTYPTAQQFLHDTQAILETQEALNSLPLGVCLRLARQPETEQSAACLKAVFDAGQLVLTAVMTPPYKMILSNPGGDHAAAVEALLKNLLEDGWRPPGVVGECRAAREFARLWQELDAGKSELARGQFLYQLRQVSGPEPEVNGALRPATMDELGLLVEWQNAFMQEALGESKPSETLESARLRIEQGDLYLWQDREPVSMAARNRPTRHGIAVSYVYTPPPARRQGYAYALVYRLSQQLLDAGYAFCTLFTDQANPTSNRIYQRIGYQQISTFEEYTFF